MTLVLLRGPWTHNLTANSELSVWKRRPVFAFFRYSLPSSTGQGNQVAPVCLIGRCPPGAVGLIEVAVKDSHKLSQAQ